MSERLVLGLIIAATLLGGAACVVFFKLVDVNEDLQPVILLIPLCLGTGTMGAYGSRNSKHRPRDRRR